jgi:hypothetical protein
MKRKELIDRFKVNNSFLNLLLTRADILNNLKVGTGYAAEYDQKSVFLILIGWELHKIGVAFRHINDTLNDISNQGFGELQDLYLKKPYFLLLIPLMQHESPSRLAKALSEYKRPSRRTPTNKEELKTGTFGRIPVKIEQLGMVIKDLNKRFNKKNIPISNGYVLIDAHEIMKEVCSE